MPQVLKIFCLCTCLLWLASSSSAQQAQQGRDIQLELGFAGEMVTGHWNPLRVSLRDQPSSELLVRMDVGNVRSGERWLEYRADLAAGSGLFIFEDDIFLPTWQSLVWRIQSKSEPKVVLATGSLSQRQRHTNKLTLVLSEGSSDYHPWLPASEFPTSELSSSELPTSEFPASERVVEVTGSSLPTRVAAYHGVSKILLLSEDVAPQSLIAAASAGVQVAVPATMRLSRLESLMPTTAAAPQRLGAGWLLALQSPADWQAPLALSDMLTLVQTSTRPHPTLPMPVSIALLLLAGYFALLFALLEWARAIGFLTAIMLALLLTPLTWLWLQRDQNLQSTTGQLRIHAGGLRYVQEYQHIFTPRAERITLRTRAAPTLLAGEATWSWYNDASHNGTNTVGSSGTVLELAAYAQVALSLRPTLASYQQTSNSESISRDEVMPESDLSLALQAYLPKGTQLRQQGSVVDIFLP